MSAGLDALKMYLEKAGLVGNKALKHGAKIAGSVGENAGSLLKSAGGLASKHPRTAGAGLLGGTGAALLGSSGEDDEQGEEDFGPEEDELERIRQIILQGR